MARHRQRQQEPKEFDEKVVDINRVSKKTKGGNKIGFTALIVIGDRKGRVGVSLGKANDVLSAIKKGVKKAKKRLVTIPLVGTTIPHEIRIKNGASRLILKPAPEGTGVIAGGSVRSVLELAGVRNVVAKTLGTNNKLSNVTTTFMALQRMKEITETKRKLGQMPEQVKKEIAKKPQTVKEVKEEQKKKKEDKPKAKPKKTTKPKAKPKKKDTKPEPKPKKMATKTKTKSEKKPKPKTKAKAKKKESK